MAEDCSSMELINGNGKINNAGLDCFVKSVKLSKRGISYAVVAIMGPQSSGKSTLLNNLFFTNFAMMDSSKGRSQTTKGIWMAKAANVEPLTIILDIEGNDGQERGEDVAFEKQSALFALALADIVLINMWHSDMGRENGANKPLLKTVFEAMTKLFLPRKTTLLFVIRDRDMCTPVETIEFQLTNMIQKMWENVPKPEGRQNAALGNFFIVKVIALCHFRYQTEDFKAEVAKLREQFNNSIAPGGLAGDSQERVPGSGFSLSAQKIWKVIKENKDLNLPAHKVMVATVRCEEIANDKFRHLCGYKGWLALEVAAKSGPVPDFGKQLSSILKTHFSEYDKEAMYFDEGVRDAKRLQLESKMLEHVRPTYETLLSHLRSQANERFKAQLEKALSRGEGFAASVRKCNESCLLGFDKECKDVVVQQAPHWNTYTTKLRKGLTRDIEEHSSSLRSKKLSDIVACYKKKLSDNIEGAYIETILIEASSGDSWTLIRELLESETETAVSKLLSSISGFDLDESTREHMKQSIREYARSTVENKAREEAGNVLTYMKDRFTSDFNDDHDFMPKSWTGEVDINKITQDARSESLKILSVMTAIRLEKRLDNIEKILYSSLMNRSTEDSFSGGVSRDPLALRVWPEASRADTIFTPVACKSLWNRFLKETKYLIIHAKYVQEANIAKLKAEKDAAVARAEADAAIEKAVAATDEARAEANAALARSLEALQAARVEVAAAGEKAEAAVEAARAEVAAAKAVNSFTDLVCKAVDAVKSIFTF